MDVAEGHLLPCYFSEDRLPVRAWAIWVAHGIDDDVGEHAGVGCVHNIRLIVKDEEDVHEVACGTEVIWRRVKISGWISLNKTGNVPLSTLGYVNAAKRPIKTRLALLHRPERKPLTELALVEGNLFLGGERVERPQPCSRFSRDLLVGGMNAPRI